MKIKINNKGIALVFVLWVLVILSVIVGQFCYSMRNEVKTAGFIKNESQAYYIANAGIVTGLEKFAKGEISGKQQEENNDLIWRINADITPKAFGNGMYKIKIGNESGKVNLNYADEPLLKILFTSIGVDKDESKVIVDSILDWRDRDTLHRLNGAENNYYQSLPQPYECRDNFFRYTDELLYVRGMTRKIYYGGLKDYISVSIISDRKKRFQRKHININAVPIELLKLLPGITVEAVENIISYRKEKDIVNQQELIKITGSVIDRSIRKYIDYQYNRFYSLDIEAWTQDKDFRQRIQVMVEKIPKKGREYKIVKWIDSVAEY